jgi:hypothetical protein
MLNNSDYNFHYKLGSVPGLGGRVVGSFSRNNTSEVPPPGSVPGFGGRVVGSIGMGGYNGIEVENRGSGLEVQGELDSSRGLDREGWELELEEMLILIPSAGVGAYMYVYEYIYVYI